MGHRGKLSEFEAYLKDRQENTFRSKNEIEGTGRQAALDRCRVACLVEIQSELSSKNPDDFVDLLALADFQVSIDAPPRYWNARRKNITRGYTRRPVVSSASSTSSLRRQRRAPCMPEAPRPYQPTLQSRVPKAPY